MTIEKLYDRATPLFFDTETTINNVGEGAVGDMAASPFSPKNHIVYLGIMLGDAPDVSVYKNPRESLEYFIHSDTPVVLVAQNIAFDLHHLYQNRDIKRVLSSKDFLLWDVMLVEYLLTGQQLKWANLDTLATIYGGTVKDSRIKEYWEAGICTSKIPEEEIIPYLKGDVENLRTIYEGQMRAAKAAGMLPLIYSQMRARAMTILMEHNGMKFNIRKAKQQQDELSVIVAKREKMLMAMAHKEIGHDIDFNPSSRNQLATLLYGGTFEYVVSEVQLDEAGKPVTFKTGLRKGEVKYKNVKKSVYTSGLCTCWEKLKVPSTPSGAMSTDTETLSDVLTRAKELEKSGARRTSLISFLEELISYREEYKMLTTYFDGYSKLMWPGTGLIHGQLNHCQTNTGRLSSSKPNLQNISNKVMEIEDESL